MFLQKKFAISSGGISVNLKKEEYFAKNCKGNPFICAFADLTTSNKESHAVEWNVWTEIFLRDTKKQQREAAVYQDLRGGMRESKTSTAILLGRRKHLKISKISLIFTLIFNGNLATVVVKGRLTLGREGRLLYLKQYVEASNAGRSGIITLLPLVHWKNDFTTTCVHLNQA